MVVEVDADVGATNTFVNQAVAAAATVYLDFIPQFIIMMIYTTMEGAATKADMRAVAATALARPVGAVHAFAISHAPPADVALAPATNLVDLADATHVDAAE